MQQKLVVVGNGMAGVRTVETLLRHAPDLYTITLFGDEPWGNYNRILLSSMLAGELSLEEILLNAPAWYREHGITLHAGSPVVRIDRRHRRVHAADGTVAEYDRLLLATGSRPALLPVAGHDLPGVIGFRAVRDVEAMRDAATRYRQALVIGGGLLGLEAAEGLRRLGMRVRVAHRGTTLLDRQLDRSAAALLQESLEARGVEFLMGASTREIIGRRRVQGVRFEDGREVGADLVVMAIGIRPNVELARDAGLHCGRGVVVDDTMQSYDPRIYAVGECAQHRNTVYGLVAPLFEQARVCANHLAELGFARYTGSVTATKLKVSGVDLFSAGEIEPGEPHESLLYQDRTRGIYKKILLRDNRIIGSILYGSTLDGPWYFQLLREGSDISAFRDTLLFGQVHRDGGQSAADRLDDDAEVCGCNGVRKGELVRAITAQGLFTLEDVRSHTKASASCGGCTALVEQILASTVGGDYSTPESKPLCGCTEFTHDEVRDTIRRRHLTSLRAAMQAMEWRTPDGCPTCRPALNYYLIATWPGEARDDPQARLVNERMHANIQKDGSFTVVPRMWGGVTTPAELRAIAAAAERYRVPLLKVTGGQRIDLVGVQRSHLPAIWADLNAAGLVSGHAYGKSLRTVKSCIGSRYCRFGTQDALAMGEQLERLTWGTWTPHKFKMAVSGCPRNCAEATIKDFGVVAQESGWALHVGGNGGVQVRATDLLTRVSEPEEVAAHCTAFLQLYRESARYLERTAPWIERVGLAWVRERVVEDADNRRALQQRFLQGQALAQQDPWSAGSARAGTFAPLPAAPTPHTETEEGAAP